MAVTKIWSVKGTLKSVVDYAMNPDKTLSDFYSNNELQSLKDVIDYEVESEKTEKQYFVSGINCNPEFNYIKIKRRHCKVIIYFR